MALHERARARARWPAHVAAARPGPGRLIVHQRDDVHARQPPRLRALGGARGEGLVLRGSAALLPKSETYDGGADAYRGGEGPLGVHRATMASPLFEVFIEAGVEAGYARNDDVNGARQEGFGPADSTVRKGRRSSAAEAYLHPVSGRPNLEVRTDTLAHRVVVEEGRARAVVLERGGARREARAEREIILSAGRDQQSEAPDALRDRSRRTSRGARHRRPARSAGGGREPDGPPLPLPAMGVHAGG